MDNFSIRLISLIMTDDIKGFNFIGEKVILDAGISYTKADSNSVILSAMVGGIEEGHLCFGDAVEVNDSLYCGLVRLRRLISLPEAGSIHCRCCRGMTASLRSWNCFASCRSHVC